VNGRKNSTDFSRLFFYKLLEAVKHGVGVPGTLDLLALPVDSAEFGGAQIPPDSLVAASADGTLGYFATTDGSFWSVELKKSPTLNVARLASYEGLVGHGGYQACPRNVRINPAGTTLSIVRPGATLNIRRPSFGKHGSNIRRPSFLKYDESPALVLVQLSDNGSVASGREVRDQELGKGASAVSNLVFTGDGGAYFTVSYTDSQGMLEWLQKSGILMGLSGSVPDNVGHIAAADGSTIVGIEDIVVSSQGASPSIEGGSLVFMSLRQTGDALVVSTGRKAAIRRPANVCH
jgi:hypothetical protein